MLSKSIIIALILEKLNRLNSDLPYASPADAINILRTKAKLQNILTNRYHATPTYCDYNPSDYDATAYLIDCDTDEQLLYFKALNTIYG